MNTINMGIIFLVMLTLSACKFGQQGPRGLQGEAGAQGAVGGQGLPGTKGHDGVDGKTPKAGGSDMGTETHGGDILRARAQTLYDRLTQTELELFNSSNNGVDEPPVWFETFDAKKQVKVLAYGLRELGDAIKDKRVQDIAKKLFAEPKALVKDIDASKYMIKTFAPKGASFLQRRKAEYGKCKDYQGEVSTAGAEIGKPGTDICIDTKKLAQETPSEEELMSLLVHEYAHHFNVEEADAIYLQSYITKNYEMIENVGMRYMTAFGLLYDKAVNAEGEVYEINTTDTVEVRGYKSKYLPIVEISISSQEPIFFEVRELSSFITLSSRPNYEDKIFGKKERSGALCLHLLMSDSCKGYGKEYEVNPITNSDKSVEQIDTWNINQYMTVDTDSKIPVGLRFYGTRHEFLFENNQMLDFNVNKFALYFSLNGKTKYAPEKLEKAQYEYLANNNLLSLPLYNHYDNEKLPEGVVKINVYKPTYDDSGNLVSKELIPKASSEFSLKVLNNSPENNVRVQYYFNK